MPTTTTGLVLFIIGSLVGLLVWWIQRRAEPPTTQKRIDDRKAEINTLFDEIAACDAIGDFATADALRRRLCELQAADGKREPDQLGQCLPGDAPGGHKDSAPD